MAPIRTAEGCEAVAIHIGKTYATAFESKGDHEYCLFADDGRNMVYFNKAPVALPEAPRMTYKSVCQSLGNVPSNSADLTKVPVTQTETIQMLTEKKKELEIEEKGSAAMAQDLDLVKKCSNADQPSRVQGSETCKQLFGPDWACCKDEKEWKGGYEPSQKTRCKAYWEATKNVEELNFQGDGVSTIHECAFVGFKYLKSIRLTSNPGLTKLDKEMFKAVAPGLRNLYVTERNERTCFRTLRVCA